MKEANLLKRILHSLWFGNRTAIFVFIGVLIILRPNVFAEKSVDLMIGVGSSVITPFLDLPLAGYYFTRTADGVHDPLQAKAIVLDDGNDQIVMVACDVVEVNQVIVEKARQSIHEQLGIPPDHVLISATHSHTGPRFTREYSESLSHWILDSVKTAVGQKRPVQLFVATEQEPSLPHNRRYLMKDGSVQTNPGFLNPEVVKPIGPIDPRVSVLFAENEQKEPIVTWVNYVMHLDTVGGTWISADYAYYLNRLLAKVKGLNMMTVFTIGAAGNINHWDVNRPGPQRGFDEAQRIGEVLGSSVIKAYTHLAQIKNGRVIAMQTIINLPVQKSTTKEVKQAKKILSVPPPRDVDFTLDRVKATRVMEIQKRHAQDLSVELQVIAVGPIAFVGIPGELFTELGLEIQKQSPFPYTFIITLANDNIDYIPTQEAFTQAGYEPTSAKIAPGGGETIVEKTIELLKKIHNQ